MHRLRIDGKDGYEVLYVFFFFIFISLLLKRCGLHTILFVKKLIPFDQNTNDVTQDVTKEHDWFGSFSDNYSAAC